MLLAILQSPVQINFTIFTIQGISYMSRKSFFHDFQWSLVQTLISLNDNGLILASANFRFSNFTWMIYDIRFTFWRDQFTFFYESRNWNFWCMLRVMKVSLCKNLLGLINLYSQNPELFAPCYYAECSRPSKGDNDLVISHWKKNELGKLGIELTFMNTLMDLWLIFWFCFSAVQELFREYATSSHHLRTEQDMHRKQVEIEEKIQQRLKEAEREREMEARKVWRGGTCIVDCCSSAKLSGFSFREVYQVAVMFLLMLFPIFPILFFLFFNFKFT